MNLTRKKSLCPFLSQFVTKECILQDIQSLGVVTTHKSENLYAGQEAGQAN